MVQRCLFKICIATRPDVYVYSETDHREELTGQEERHERLLEKQAVDWMDNQAANEKEKKKLMSGRSKNKRKMVRRGGSASRFFKNHCLAMIKNHARAP